MKTAIPTIVLIAAGLPLMLSNAGVEIDVNALGKTGMITACLVAIIFLWRELKEARRDFTNFLQEAGKKRDDLAEIRLESDHRLTNALESLTKATEKSIASSDRSVRMVEDLQSVLRNTKPTQ